VAGQLDGGTIGKRDAKAIYRRLLDHRADVQSDDLQPRHQTGRILRFANHREISRGQVGRRAFFELALEDLKRAAAMFARIHDQTNGVDGWVSLEVSPLLAHETATTLAAARALHAQAGLSDLLIKIPGTKEGVAAIEEAIFEGIPINVTLLFSREQYIDAAEAFIRGIERRLDAGLKADVASVASFFVSRWDAAVMDKVSGNLRGRLGIAVARRMYKAYRMLLSWPRSQRVYNAGGRPQRLVWASTGTKDPYACDVVYIKALAAPFTVNTMPESTLKALGRHSQLDAILPVDGGDCEQVLAQFSSAGIEIDTLAARLQEEGVISFAQSWNDLMSVIASKAAVLRKVS